MLARGEARSPLVRTAAAELVASEIQRHSEILSGLSKDARADELNYFLRQPDGVHEFYEILGGGGGLWRELPAVLLDSLGCTQEGDDGLLPLGALIRYALRSLAALVHALRQVLTQQRAAGADNYAG